uniref:Uncharacterized protein n=1 Tax=Arundo donax TaxID=35708 RepID=A0A0A9BCV1_ARUDO
MCKGRKDHSKSAILHYALWFSDSIRSLQLQPG